MFILQTRMEQFYSFVKETAAHITKE